MQNVTANQPFYGTREEGMWQAGDTREVSPARAKELIGAGLADTAKASKKEDKADASTKEDKSAEARATKATK